MTAPNVNRHPDNVRRDGNQGVRRRVLTREALYADALARLGFPQVDADVDKSQLDIFLERTLDTYNSYVPVQKEAVLPQFAPHVSRYDLEQLGAPYGRGVVDARLVARTGLFSPSGGFFGLGVPTPVTRLSPDAYSLAIRHLDMTRRVFSASFDWKWDEPALWIHASPGYEGQVTVAYTYHTEAHDLSGIPSYHYPWVKDYFYNLVRLAVGEARSRFGTIPGPGGGMQLNGPEMVQRAEDKLRELEEDIRSRGMALVPPIGPARGAGG